MQSISRPGVIHSSRKPVDSHLQMRLHNLPNFKAKSQDAYYDSITKQADFFKQDILSGAVSGVCYQPTKCLPPQITQQMPGCKRKFKLCDFTT